MPSKIVQYHAADDGIALLQSESGFYWIGEYFPFYSHQNGEPPYVWVSGNWDSLDEAKVSLALWV